MFPTVHDDRARVSFIDKQAFRYTNNMVSDYFQLKTDLLFEESKSGKALASLVAPSPTPLYVRGNGSQKKKGTRRERTMEKGEGAKESRQGRRKETKGTGKAS